MDTDPNTIIAHWRDGLRADREAALALGPIIADLGEREKQLKAERDRLRESFGQILQRIGEPLMIGDRPASWVPASTQTSVDLPALRALIAFLHEQERPPLTAIANRIAATISTTPKSGYPLIGPAPHTKKGPNQ